MPRLSDIIETFIKNMLQQSNEMELEIKRNELANYFSCAPSQINYVLTTRFTTEKGYYIESKRGGGGCIKIKKIHMDKVESLAEVINEKIGNNITYNAAINIVKALKDDNIITLRESNIIKICLNDRTLTSCIENKNKLRADILKSILLSLLS